MDGQWTMDRVHCAYGHDWNENNIPSSAIVKCTLYTLDYEQQAKNMPQ